MTASTSPKPPTPADPNDLRTALTKLADKWESRVNQSRLWWDGAGELRALLAAHPAEVVSDTRREDVARRLHGENDGDGAACALCLDKADAVLAALPAPPVVDEASIRDLARAERHRVHEESEFFSWSSQSDAHDDGYVAGYIAAARLRGATRG